MQNQGNAERRACNGRALLTVPFLSPSDVASSADASAGMLADASARMGQDAGTGIGASARMHRSAVAFALRHGLALGRYGEGHGAATGLYFLRCPATLAEAALSMQPTAASALAMMRRALRCGRAGQVTR